MLLLSLAYLQLHPVMFIHCYGLLFYGQSGKEFYLFVLLNLTNLFLFVVELVSLVVYIVYGLTDLIKLLLLYDFG